MHLLIINDSPRLKQKSNTEKIIQELKKDTNNVVILVRLCIYQKEINGIELFNYFKQIQKYYLPYLYMSNVSRELWWNF